MWWRSRNIRARLLIGRKGALIGRKGALIGHWEVHVGPFGVRGEALIGPQMLPGAHICRQGGLIREREALVGR